MTDRTIAPAIVDAVDFDVKLLPVNKYLLGNNVPVYFLREGAEEVVNIDWVFNAGNLYEDQDDVSLATCSLLKNGTGSMNAYQLTEKLEYYGAFFQVSFGHETITLTLSCLSRHLYNLLPIIREIISDSVFSNEELEIYKQNSLQRLVVNKLKCEYVADILMNEVIFGTTHPYARSQTEESIGELNREVILSFYTKYIANGVCRIFAVGELPLDFEANMDRIFGDLEFKSELKLPLTIIKESREKQVSRLVDEKGVQGAVRLCRPFPGRNHPDFKRVSVVNTLFGGYFGSRLMNNIREEKGYTYGIYSYIQSHREAGAWLITTEAGKDVCAATINEVYNEMNILCEEKVDIEELSLVKNYLLGIYLSQIDGPFKIMARWKSLILKDWDERHFYESIQIIKDITPEEIQELAQKYFVAEEFKEIVVI